MVLFKNIFISYINTVFYSYSVFRAIITCVFYCGLIILVFATHGIASSQETQYDWFWLFYESEKNDQCQTKIFRPFFMRNIQHSNNNIFEASLMPVVYWRYKTQQKNEWKSLFGLIGSLDYIHPNGVSDYDFGFFPFLLYGNSENKNDKYLLFWPLGGTIKGKLGQKKISAYAFPGFVLFFFFPPALPPTLITSAILIVSLIPFYVDYQYKDYKAWGILWPIIQRGRSSEREDIRVLPFYAHNYTKNKYESYSIMMLFNYQRKTTKNDEQRTFFAFPFYGKRWNRSSDYNSSTILWPFFSWGYDLRRGDFELNFPWPLVQLQKCENPHIKKQIFFPLFGKYEYENQKTLFITPLYFSLKRSSKNFDSEYYINALFFWYFKREYKNKPSPIYGKSWRYYKIWPLFHYEQDDRGNFSFNFLSLLPMRDPEGYERLYQPFWTIMEYSRLQSGESRLGMLWRIYYQRWSKKFLYIKMPFIFSYSASQGRLIKLSFFFSIFCYNNDNNEKSMRIFWIPLKIGSDSSNNKIQAKYKQKKIHKEEKAVAAEKEEEFFYCANRMDWAQWETHDIRVRNDVILYTMRVF